MSEDEKRIRLNYRRVRKKWITVQLCVLVVFLVAALICSVLAYTFNRSYYVTYTEKSSVDYGVHLKENDFYEESFLGKDYAYVASLIDTVETYFKYDLDMQSPEAVDFSYTYRIDSVVKIQDRLSGSVLYAPVYNEVPETEATSSGRTVSIKKTAFADYGTYNAVANRFIDTYKLQNAQASLIMQMTVSVNSKSDAFYDNESTNKYVSSISIPLRSDTVEIRITSATPKGEQKILSHTTEGIAAIFRTLALILAIIGLFIAAALVSFAYLSRNVDITYDIKIARLLRSYKSFIQRITNRFVTDGYNVLQLESFNEMLEIRDTIQSPILMEENEDRTCTKFYIPTNTNLLYLFEIKVDDYDRIYRGNTPDPIDPAPTDGGAPHAEDSVYATEEPVINEDSGEPEIESELVLEDEEPVPAAIAEPVAEPVADDFTEELAAEPVTESVASDLLPEGVEIIEELPDADGEPTSIAYIDESGAKIQIACNRSFAANLIQSNAQIKEYYSTVKNYILSNKGVKSRTSWRFESYNKGRTQLFKMKIRGKTICLYCALDPDAFEKSRFFHERATAKNLSAVPMMVRIKSDRGLKRVLGLVDLVMERFEVKKAKTFTEVDYPKDYPYETTKALVERGLIKILIPGAEAAEPAPHHHIHKKMVKVVHDNVEEELTIFDAEKLTEEQIAEVIHEAEAPDISLEEIDYVEAPEAEDFVETEEKSGVDVIGVVWPERPTRNKVYRYDPDGEVVETGDTVIVPTRDASRERDVVRKAVVAHENHKIDPDTLKHPLKKIIGVLRRKDK